MTLNRALGGLLDALWLIGLAAYIVAGVPRVPFHGDESTLIAMSRDYALLVQQHDLDAVLYRPRPTDPAAQELRLLNGTVGKMAMGLAWDLDGLSERDLNQGWDWSAGWDLNLVLHHLPSDRLLHAARLSSALLTALAAWCVFGIARLAAGSRIAAWATSLLFVTTPAVLLDGRRAMMEGSHLGFATLTVLVAVLLVRWQARGARPRTLWAAWIALGAAGGCALASKHTAAIAVGLAAAVAALEPAVRARAWRPVLARAHVLRVLTFGGVLGLIFLALNPAWWSDPIGMPGRVVEMRTRLITSQGDTYGRMSGLGERVTALIDETFVGQPQWYEAPAWANYAPVTAEIDAYRTSWLAGRPTGLLGGVLLALAGAVGTVGLLRRWREGPALLVLVWAWGTALALLLTIPMHWQRYYLPIQPALAVVVGIGVGQVIRAGWRWARRAPAVEKGGA